MLISICALRLHHVCDQKHQSDSPLCTVENTWPVYLEQIKLQSQPTVEAQTNDKMSKSELLKLPWRGTKLHERWTTEQERKLGRAETFSDGQQASRGIMVTSALCVWSQWFELNVCQRSEEVKTDISLSFQTPVQTSRLQLKQLGAARGDLRMHFSVFTLFRGLQFICCS